MCRILTVDVYMRHILAVYVQVCRKLAEYLQMCRMLAVYVHMCCTLAEYVPMCYLLAANAQMCRLPLVSCFLMQLLKNRTAFSGMFAAMLVFLLPCFALLSPRCCEKVAPFAAD